MLLRIAIMAVTFSELKQRLIEQTDPDVLVELLDLSSEEIAEAFADKIEERLEQLQDQYFTEEERDDRGSE